MRTLFQMDALLWQEIPGTSFCLATLHRVKVISDRLMTAVVSGWLIWKFESSLFRDQTHEAVDASVMKD